MTTRMWTGNPALSHASANSALVTALLTVAVCEPHGVVHRALLQCSRRRRVSHGHLTVLLLPTQRGTLLLHVALARGAAIWVCCHLTPMPTARRQVGEHAIYTALCRSSL
eukprot:m.39977 g.39977  ORF g.39977 m.39977 type:complete len:110 (-) comp13811_c0_seq1:194-523(-)